MLSHFKVGDVRLHALQTLLQLYEVEEFLPQLEPLTSRFKVSFNLQNTQIRLDVM